MGLGLGLYVPTWPGAAVPAPGERSSPPWLEIRALALDAEALGLDTLWVADEPGFWECWTILSALAEATTTVGLGPLVTCTRYRVPTLFVTMVRALDEVSGGRVTLGLGSGAGPGDRRWPAYGWDPAAHVARFGEATEVIVRGLRDGTVSFQGRFHEAHEPNLGPAGPRPSGPPVWIAARRPRTMEVAARWGDAVNWNAALVDEAAVQGFREATHAACESVSRDADSIELTGWTRIAPSVDGKLDADRDDTIAGTPDAIAERLVALHAAGVAHMTCFIGDEDDAHAYPALTRRSLERFAPILAAVRRGERG